MRFRRIFTSTKRPTPRTRTLLPVHLSGLPDPATGEGGCMVPRHAATIWAASAMASMPPAAPGYRRPTSWRRWRAGASAPASCTARVGRLTATLPLFHAMTFDDVEGVAAAVETILIHPQVPQ